MNTGLAYECRCGYRFGYDLGPLGCPNCCGDFGPARLLRDPGMSISTQRLALVDSMLCQARYFADELISLHQDVKDGAGLDVGKQHKLEADLRATLQQINQVLEGAT